MTLSVAWALAMGPKAGRRSDRWELPNDAWVLPGSRGSHDRRCLIGTLTSSGATGRRLELVKTTRAMTSAPGAVRLGETTVASLSTEPAWRCSQIAAVARAAP